MSVCVCWGGGEKECVWFVCEFNLHSDVLTTNCIIGKHLLINDSEKTRQTTIVYVCMGLFRPKHQLNVRRIGAVKSLEDLCIYRSTHTYRTKIKSRKHLYICIIQSGDCITAGEIHIAHLSIGTHTK